MKSTLLSPPAIVVILMVFWSSLPVHAGSILCDDPSELCLSKRFLRFGRGLSQDPYYQLSRQFYRLNRSYQPYQDKRFLRFGRSQLQGLYDLYDSDGPEPFSRKRRSPDTSSQLEVTHNHVRRSIDQSAIETSENDETSHVIKKRSADDVSGLGLEDFSRDGQADSMIEKRSVDQEFGGVDENNNQLDKRFMRFGKSVSPAKRFMRFGRNNGMGLNGDLDTTKRFMRFGKRFIRFGKREGGGADKRFIRFGKRGDLGGSEDEEAAIDKLSDILSLANGLKKESGELDDGVYDTEKRFIRFGKRDGLDKRFIRFGKKSSLGKEEVDAETLDCGIGEANVGKLNNVLSLANGLDNDVQGTEKRFIRFGKRGAV